MAEKERTQATLSFEQILGWFGRFTPQFKFRLLLLKKHSDAAAFERFARETLDIFRQTLFALSRLPKGPERAYLVFDLMDESYAAGPKDAITCHAGCSACCKLFPKQITDDEADVLAELVKKGDVSISMDELRAQTAKLRDTKDAATPCLFLSQDNRCQVYSSRPAVCRKYHVTSDPKLCADPKGESVPEIDLMAELIASAAMSLPDNGIDFMALQLSRRLDPEFKPVQSPEK